MDLWWLWRLFGLQLLVLEGRLLGEGAARPGRRRSYCGHRLFLLLLLVVGGGGRVDGSLVAGVRRACRWTVQYQEVRIYTEMLLD